MNPLLLPGPQFLVFYVMLAGAVFFACWWARRAILAWGEPSPADRLFDPYEIAVLRAGSREAIRVGLLALASRGAAHAAGDRVQLDQAPLTDAHPFERVLAQEIAAGASVPALEKSAVLEGRLGRITASLMENGLLCDSERQTLLIAVLAVGSGFLAFVALAKFSIALATGHNNVLFLVITAAAAALAPALLYRKRTPRGDAALLAVKDGWSGATLASGTPPVDVAMGAAIFGLGIAPLALQPFASAIQKPVNSGGAGCGGGGGSGCGGDGGGCGGGCGGCGGCGG